MKKDCINCRNYNQDTCAYQDVCNYPIYRYSMPIVCEPKGKENKNSIVVNKEKLIKILYGISSYNAKGFPVTIHYSFNHSFYIINHSMFAYIPVYNLYMFFLDMDSYPFNSMEILQYYNLLYYSIFSSIFLY